MSDSSTPRLKSLYLEDLAAVVLGDRHGDQPLDTVPIIDDKARQRLRARLKQIARLNWPVSLIEDPLIRRGYSLHQCCRILIALLLTDAHLPPAIVVAIARANERVFIEAMIERMEHDALADRADDQLAVILLADLVDLIGHERDVAVSAVTLMRRSDLLGLWSVSAGMDRPGQRLVIDVGRAAAVMWRWLRSRQLMPTEALSDWKREN